MAEYGYDYDTGKTVYHYGDGFATDDKGKHYVEDGSGYMMDMKTGDVHYAPTESSSSGGSSYELPLGFYIGVGFLLFCIVYTYMIFHTYPKYIFHALVTGVFAYYFLSKKYP